MTGRNDTEKLAGDSRPAILVSFYYLKNFLKVKDSYAYRDWALDSGAFSAHNSGATIQLDEYMATCKMLMEQDPTLTEIFALDVIGDWQASLKNCEVMWKAGIPAIPCYHVNEPESALLEMARTYPKIALGGVALAKTGKKMKWAAQCFARVWPKRIHGFAFCGEEALMGLPWHSVDASSWEIGPCGFGNWKTYGKMSVRGSCQNLRTEVEWYLRLEARARHRWAKEMKKLDADGAAPSNRLVLGSTCSTNPEQSGGCLRKDETTLRLVAGVGGSMDSVETSGLARRENGEHQGGGQRPETATRPEGKAGVA